MFFTFSLLSAYFLASDRNRSPPRPPRLSPVVFRRDVPLRSFRLMLRRAMLPTKRRRHTPIIYITAVLLSFLATLVRLVQPRSCRPGRRIHLPLRSVAALRTGVRRYIIVGSSLFSRRPTPLRPLPLCGPVEEKSVRRRVAIASARSGKKGDVSRCTSVVSSLVIASSSIGTPLSLLRMVSLSVARLRCASAFRRSHRKRPMPENEPFPHSESSALIYAYLARSERCNMPFR